MEAAVPLLADVLAQGLHEAGVETVFGLPGGENTELLDAFRRQGIGFVLVSNESSAVYMADVTARLTARTGVCLTTLGPGATNAVAGVAHAYLDRAPVLVITAQTPDQLLPYHTHQVVNLQALFAPVTKKSVTLTPERASEVLQAALKLTLQGRPGPVHLGLSNEAAGQPARQTNRDRSDAHRSKALPPAELAGARERWLGANRPVIMVGLGMEPARPYDALRALAESVDAPVITTPKAKGSLPADHRLAAGTIGLTRTDPAYQILDEADCILAVGFDVVELVKPWDQPAPLIWSAPWVNTDPVIPAEFDLVGPMEDVLQQLTASASATAANWGPVRVARLRAELAQVTAPSPGPGRLLPQTVLEIVRQNIPRDSVLTTDVGSHKILWGLAWPSYVPNRYMVSNGLSGMGFGLPAAIAAGLALPSRPTICITGDGGLAMVLGELGLLAQLQLPVIVVVLNDGALDLIRSAQLRAGKQKFGTEFKNPDFGQIASAYQLDGYRVTNQVECVEAIKAAVAASRPALIEVMIDPVSYPTTPTAVS
jgi:acetolactate synthase-1/2/3 large subunit